MELSKKIEELKPTMLNCNAFSIYDYPECYSVTELLCKFFTAINECIKVCNNTIDLVEWLVNEGLAIEVAKKLQQWLEDGTLAKIINETLFKELNDKIKKVGYSHATYNLLLEGCVGDGETDNKEVIEGIFNKLKSGDSIYIPYGTFLVKLSDDDLKDSGMNRKAMYPWLIQRGIDNLTIFGNGTIKFDCSKVIVKKACIAMLFECDNLKIEGVEFKGDAVFNSSVTYTDIGLNGISLVRCNNYLINFVRMSNILATIMTTGDIITPSISGVVSKDGIISNCFFKDYGQISTFGNGTSRLIFSNNVCINPLQSGFKISTYVEGENPINKSHDIIFSNNIIYWEKNYSFAQVGWVEGKTFCPVGFMIEGHTNNVKIENNIIDMSNISDSLKNPITDYAPIFLFGTYLNNELTNEGIELRNNKLYSVNNQPSIIFNPNHKSIIVDSNELKGAINAVTYSPNNVGKSEGIYIKNNTFLSNFGFGIKNVNTRVLEFSNNESFNSILKEVPSIFINENNIDYLVINDNKLPDEILETYVNLNCIKVVVNNNIINKISNLGYSKENGLIELKGNSFNTTDTLCKLDIGTDNTIIDFSNNTGRTNGGSIINVNKGEIYLNNNSVKAMTGTPYNLGNCVVKSGLIKGSGEPTNINCDVGVMYRDLNVVTPALYIKIGDGMELDKWKLLS